MKNIKNVFRNLEKKLRQSNWFDDNWDIYNRGEYLQLYKVGWHNEKQGGIHFETYIEAPQIKQKAFPICMHAEYDCPSNYKFIEKFLEIEAERIQRLKGYQIVGKGYSVLQRTLPLNFKNLEQKLYEEFNQLRQLENGVDRALHIL